MAGLKKLLKNKFTWIIAAAVLLVIVAVIVGVFLVGKDKSESTTPSTAPTTAEVEKTYTVVVKNKAGKPLSNLKVFIYADEPNGEMISFGKTDADGKICFTNKSGSYFASFEDLPSCYVAEKSYPITAEQTAIQLDVKTMTDADMDMTYQLGDVLLDFTVTDSDGASHTISRLLETKKAVVLSFWSVAAESCKDEFAYLQETYSKYSKDVAVLALNPVDQDDAAIAAYRQENGLTFPMAKVDAKWANILSLADYPAMVVVDRYGNICLIHRDTVGSTEAFDDVFAYFTADNYQQKFIGDIKDIVTVEEVTGTKENPMEISGVTEFEVTVEPGQEIYCNIYRVSNMLMQIHDADAYVVWDDATYKPENGSVNFVLTTPDTYTPANVRIGNNGSQSKTFKILFIAPAGSLSNPHALEMDNFRVNVDAGNEQGVYYIYTATAKGTITVRCTAATAGVTYSYTLYNLNTYAYRSLEADGVKDPVTGVITLSVDVNEGDVVQFCVSTLPDESNQYPAADLDFVASFAEKTGSDVDNPPVVQPEKKVDYTVKVTNDSNQPISGVVVTFSGSTTTNATTNASGIATVTLVEGEYTVSVQAPAGFLSHSTTYSLTSSNTSVTIRLVDPSTSDNFTELYVGYAMHVSTGKTDVNLVPEELTYFLFTPTRAGKYQFTASATISYWGSNTNFIMDLTGTTDLANNKFHLNIKEDNLGASYILAIQAPAGVSTGTLTITRLGDPDIDISDLPWDEYEGKHTPQSFQFPGGELTYVDVCGDSANYKIFLASDGFYHLGSETGPVVYLNLGTNAPYISLAKILETSPIRKIFNNGNGSVKKVDYTQCVSDYASCMDRSTGVYPLTEDLRTVLQEYGQSEGWWSQSGNGYYLFGDLTGLNADIAWMFACCYVA